MTTAMRKALLCLSLIPLTALCLAATAAAQEQEHAGALSGRVADAAGNPLPGALVHLAARGPDATTDVHGRFLFTGLPAGQVTLEISCIGFVSVKREITLAPGHDQRVEVSLDVDLHVSETVTVTASRSRGEVEALNQEKNAQDIVDVLPADIITSLPNTNVADAVGRLPSVSLERDEGEGKYIQIRGTEPRLSNFEVNGVHIPSPESTVRNVKLDIIPAELIGSLELHKTLSADREGDAIGGSVNLVTRTPGDQGYWSLGALGGYTDILGERTFEQSSGTWAGRFGEDRRLGLAVGGSYDWNGRGINDIEPVVGTAALPAGTVPEFTSMDIREYRYQRSRWGFTPSLDYQLSPAATFFVRGLFSDFRNYGDRWVYTPTAGNFLTPTTTDDTGNVTGSVQNRRPHEQIYNMTAGGANALGNTLIDYRLAFSHSQQLRLNEQQADFAGPADVAFLVDGSNPYFPSFIPINGVDVQDPTLYSLSDFRIANERTAAHDVNGDANVSFAHRLAGEDGELKVGVRLRDEHKDDSNHDLFLTATGAPALTLDQVLDPLSDPGYYHHRYQLGPLANLPAIAAFLHANPGAVLDDPAQDHLRDDPNNFTASERVGAAFAMETVRWTRASLNFGVRVERTAPSYTGFKVIDDANGNYVSTSPVSGGHDYTDVLPSASLRYELDPQSNLRLAYGRGLSRPNFGDLPPFFIQDDQGRMISTGNPALVPTRSHNYDLLAERYLPTVGTVNAGVFYKDLSDPIYTVSSPITSGPFNGFTLSQPINGRHAWIAGVEATWQQHLTFLPWGLNGLGVLANYTYTKSRAEVPGRSDNPSLLRTTPNEANVGLTYDRGRLSSRVALTYNDAYIWQYNFTPGAPLGIRGPGGDVYLFPHTQLDAQASYILGNGLQVLINLLNLNDEVFGFYQGSPRFPIQREFYGRSFSLGLRLVR